MYQSRGEKARHVYISDRNTNNKHKTSEIVRFTLPIDNWTD
jgi:hypothetical protein